YALLHPSGEDGWTPNILEKVAKENVPPPYPGENELAEAEAEEVQIDEREAQVEEEQAQDIPEDNDQNDDDHDDLLAGDENDDDDDFWIDINLNGENLDDGPNAKYVSARAFYAYRLQIRPISATDWRSYFWMFGRLCHQYVVDQFAKI
ncbi:hypothetical protein EC968_000669, partial [Mortierella alpina]